MADTAQSDEREDHPPARIARIRFGFLVGSHALAQFGSVMVMIALPWFVLQTTGSATQTGFTGAALAAAAVVGGLVGGLVVDRIGFKRSSYLSDFVSAAAVMAIPVTYATVGVPYWGVLVLVFLARLLDIPAFTARRSLVPELATSARIPLERGNGIFEGAQHVAALTGPAAAGAAIAVVGSANAFAVSAVVIFLAAIAVLMLVPSEERGEERPASAGISGDILAGLRFIVQEKMILAILIALVGINLLTTPIVGVILPVYVDEAIGNPSYLGLLVSALGLGTLAGAMLYAWIGHRVPRRNVWLGGQLLLPMPFIALFLELPVAVVFVAMVIAGIGSGPLNPLMVTIRHERSPVELRGRVFSTFSAAAQLAGPLGMMLVGVLVDGGGLSPVLIGIAVLMSCSGSSSSSCRSSGGWMRRNLPLVGNNGSSTASALGSADSVSGSMVGVNQVAFRLGASVTTAAELQQEINEAHERFFAMLEGFDDTELETQPICGVWSARDVAGHLADWHLEMIEAVRRIRSGDQPKRFIRDIDAFNHDQAAVRGIQPWRDAADDLRDAWGKVIAALDDIEDHEFQRIGPLPWGTVEPLNSFFRRRILRHTRTHADDAEAWRMRKLGIREHTE